MISCISIKMSEHRADLAAIQPCVYHFADFQMLFFFLIKPEMHSQDFKAYNFFRPLLKRSDFRKDKCMPGVDEGQNKLSVDIFQV